MTRSRDITHGEYTWHFEQAGLEQGAYHVADPERRKVAVIFPSDRSKPIEKGCNARLFTRAFGSADWQERGVYPLKEAMTKGNEHIHRYRVRDQSAHTLQQIRKEGLTIQERAIIEELRSRDQSQTKKAGARDTPGASAWHHIREARQRSEAEKQRDQERDDERGRER